VRRKGKGFKKIKHMECEEKRRRFQVEGEGFKMIKQVEGEGFKMIKQVEGQGF